MKLLQTKILQRLLVLVCVALLSACDIQTSEDGISVTIKSDPSDRIMSLDRPDVPVLQDCDDCPELVVVAPGEFKRDVSWYTNERKPSLVSIKYSFAIGSSEVTVAQYETFLKSEKKTVPNSHKEIDSSLPVTDVSWNDAIAYTEWLSNKTGMQYRLPSESEWEYAARANTQTEYFWGNNWWDCSNCALTRSTTGPAPVKSYAPNQFGLYDVAGNAYEWTEDCYNVHLRRAPKDGSAWIEAKGEYASCDFRIIRGGSWRDGYRKHGSRLWFDQKSTSDDIGFRVVRDIEAQPAGMVASGHEQ